MLPQADLAANQLLWARDTSLSSISQGGAAPATSALTAMDVSFPCPERCPPD